MKDLKSQFIDWLETKPEDERYDYGDQHGCAFCQFLKDNGVAQNPWVGGWSWWEGGRGVGPERDIPVGLVRPLQHDPHTFGALRSRLMAQS